ncbi:MraY family glycosyltransferase [Candidatus Margulisiibacteriota bacterium]
MSTIDSVIITIFATIIIVPIIRYFAKRYKVIDLPGRRKVHHQAVPLMGGVAIYLGFLVGLLLNYDKIGFILPVFVAGTIILVVGVIDDIRGLSPQLRLAAQLAAAIIILSFGFRITFFPNAIWGVGGEILLTLLWIIGLTNAFNYLDGIDGLAAGTTAIAAVFISMIAALNQQPMLGLAGLLLASACLGFLPYNFSKNKMFLGDAGSTFLGFTIAAMALAGNWAEDSILRLSIPILILGVPIFDMVFTTVMRIREGKVHSVVGWLKYSGKDHFHHRLVDLGLRPLDAVFTILLITIALGINAVIISYSSGRFIGILSVMQAAIILTLIAVLMVVGKRRRSGWNIQEKGGE